MPKTCGIVELDERGVVIRFHEKVANPPGNHANAAVYIVEPFVIDFLASIGKEVIDISTEVLPRYLGRMQAFHNSDYHRDIGTPESLALAEREF
jgi:mannose-1-phosphate guanylyltransferase